MKTARDPRHRKRLKAVRELFAWEFNPGTKLKIETAVRVSQNLEQIDKELQRAASERPIGQINRIDLAVLRLAVFELIIEKAAPCKVVVDEAVEIAKELGTESSPGFVNGVLGNIISTHDLEK